MRRREEDEQKLSDLELVRLCSEGDARARELLYRRYFSFAMSVCIRYTKDEHEAMEIVNDSYMKVLGSIDQFDGTRSFRSWYGRILVNSAIDSYRRKVKHSMHLPTDDLEIAEEAEPLVTSGLSVQEILSLFSQLPDNYKVTFNLYEIEGYSHEEIGKMLGVTTSTSRSNLTRARHKLRELYKKNFNPPGKSDERI
ncbi:MAG TPA: RNA polymerase sigma factor [Bacteroidales bacterium]|nr:RNA polymerase sigma factor [Bacteroidales bacterium]HPF03548.1 RNA polymerase sigma factor [Bacteroidales bacterium]HPJ58767.1 RNA polymerase sigma factor [Bacteroidales bacterium]HPR11917.1 RNA polymerase sigma factor [Bacteroidales bacterium]HRW85384.1 RNA polymerase sigma factor [Bacteroidales bacterium]